jgi:prevent-host-death family protein
MPENSSAEVGIRELRATLSEVVNETAVRGRITYVTSRGRRVAAIVPVPDAEAIEAKRQPEGGPSAE